MYITVKEALQLERLQHFRPAAGQKGLHRKIEKISLLDYEVVNRIEGQFLKNEFALSSLLGAKDDPTLILESVKYLVQSGVSGLAIKNIYFDQLPKEVIDYADACDFPIFIFDNSVFFEDIITDVKDALRELEKGAESEYQLNTLLNSNVSAEDVCSLFHRIIGFLKKPFQVIYLKERPGLPGSDLLSGLERFRGIKSDTIKGMFKYNQGLLMVYTTDNYKETLYRTDLNYLGINPANYWVGKSSFFNHEKYFKAALQQALWSSRAANAEALDEMTYQEIGVYKLIIPFLENGLYDEFQQEMILPVKEYDRKHGTELFETARQYVANEGDIIKTAAALFQHSNTIRYRINKIGSILNLNASEGTFYEHLSIAFRILRLKSSGF